MKVEIVHQRDPDDECGFVVYVDGQRVDASIFSVDAGAGYEFSDWANAAYADKQSASPTVWHGVLAECYADPCGAEYIKRFPGDAWITHLDDTDECRQWWADNLPGVTAPFRCMDTGHGTRCALPYGHVGEHYGPKVEEW